MTAWVFATLVAMAVVAGGLIYIHVRWRRSPHAYRAMIALAACYFVAGSVLAAWALHLAAPKSTVEATRPSTIAAPSISPPSVTLPIPPLHYDPAHAVLPVPNLTPGDTLPGATAEDVCTPGWATEHRHVTEADKGQAYADYSNSARTCRCSYGGSGCCEVDHLIPLELGGSNDIKNLWPQPIDPRPGSYEKDELENLLHRLVCEGRISL